MRAGRLRVLVRMDLGSLLPYWPMLEQLAKQANPCLYIRVGPKTLMDTWVEDVEAGDDAYFTVSENGWSNHSIGQQWLRKVFDPNTKPTDNRRRLLIMDGHSSHLNLAFLKACDELNIILLIFPPHTTHRLQPLDIGCFLPLATAYSHEALKLLHESEGIIALTKRDFWRLFRTSWKKSMTEANITKSFAKAGIWPLLPAVVMDILKAGVQTPKKTLSSEVAHSLKTPYNNHEHRQLIKAASNGQLQEAFDKLVKANETLSVQLALAENRVKGYTNTLKVVKKGGRKGQPLNLAGDPTGGASVWATEEISRAETIAEAKKAKAQAIAIAKASNQAQKNAKGSNKASGKGGKKPATKKQLLNKEVGESSGVEFDTDLGEHIALPSTPKKKQKAPKLDKTVSTRAVRFLELDSEDNLSSDSEPSVVEVKYTRTGRLVRAPRPFEAKNPKTKK